MLMRAAGLQAERALLVSDTRVTPLYAAQAAASLEAAGYRCSMHVFEAGEAHKRLATVEGMYAALATHGLGRGDVIVALGGGVVGDMAGFAAATWMRGIRFVQAPTTLLAQVDSSVGGKTAVDTRAGKNLVGAFWQPSLVVADVDTLDTLPPAAFADGMAEVVKTACIRDAALLAKLEAKTPRGDAPELEAVIARCVDIKRAIVEEDERDAGVRGLLNFGHTVGHALERYSDYTLSHGSAVAVGMVVMARAGESLGVTVPGTAARLTRVLTAYGLPTHTDARPSDWAPLMMADKKRHGEKIDLVLLREMGDAVLHPIDVQEAIAQVLP
jgi:3-dehydroquinate synthase